MQLSPRLWDATPGVCCAAFQLGACEHTEAYGEPEDWELEDDPHPHRTTGDDEVHYAEESEDDCF